MRQSSASPRFAYVLLTLATLFWAGNAIVGRALHADVPPVTFAFWRWVLAPLFLLPLSWQRLRTDLTVLRAWWPAV